MAGGVPIGSHAGGPHEEDKNGTVPIEPSRVLVIGGGLAGLEVARELGRGFRVTVVDAKEYFEFTPGIMRAYCQPERWETLTFMYYQVLERIWRVRFIWGEVTGIDSGHKCARVTPMFAAEEDVVPFDYCVIASGCNFNQMLPTGESPWFPLVHECNRSESLHPQLDERFLEGRRRRILEEHLFLQQLNQQQAQVLIVGAGFMGVEWACELRHFFPGLRIVLIDFLPRCLGPLPADAARYCEDYMQRHNIKTHYGVKFDKDSQHFWTKIGLPFGAAKIYTISGVKNSNYFMPKSTLSDRGPGGGGWIVTSQKLQVVHHAHAWGDGRIFAVGDCTSGCVGEAPNWEIPPMPKTGYPAEQHAVHVSRNIRALDRALRSGAASAPALLSTWYPWGAGVFSISLGPADGCVVIGARDEKGSGRMFGTGAAAVLFKEIIESTKLGQCRGDHFLSRVAWYMVHHWPINVCGKGPLWSL